MSDSIMVRGPESLADLLSVIAPTVAPPAGEVVSFNLLDRDVYAVAQFDIEDADTWPYMVSVDSNGDGFDDEVRQQSLLIVGRIRTAGWLFQAVDDATDAVITESVLSRS